jgi:hypothetical protein
MKISGKLRCDAMIGKPGGGFTPARKEKPCPRLAKYEAVDNGRSPLHYCEAHKGHATDPAFTIGRTLKPLERKGD